MNVFKLIIFKHLHHTGLTLQYYLTLITVKLTKSFLTWIKMILIQHVHHKILFFYFEIDLKLNADLNNKK